MEKKKYINKYKGPNGEKVTFELRRKGLMYEILYSVDDKAQWGFSFSTLDDIETWLYSIRDLVAQKRSDEAKNPEICIILEDEKIQPPLFKYKDK